MSYQLAVSGLSECVAAARFDAKHTHLISDIRRMPDLENANLVATGPDGRHCTRKVLSSTGHVVSDDHAAWLRAEMAKSDVLSAWRHLRTLDHQLSVCDVKTLYVTVDQGGARQDNFIQIEIDLEVERLDRRLFSPNSDWDIPRDDLDLIRLAEEGPSLADDQRVKLRATGYRLNRVVDVALFNQLAEQLYNESNARNAARQVKLTDDAGRIRTGTMAELFPQSMPGAWKGRRLFEDWAYSSAGRSGARFCDHWALRLADWKDPRSPRRDMSLVPIWGFRGRLAEIAPPSMSDYSLYGKLEAMDRRLGVPFGWYTYMLHGNRVHAWAGERVIRAAEAGKLVLPEHDYRVLKAWQVNPYGF